MVRQCLKAFNAPIGLYDWCVKWVKDVHNVSASHKLNWKTPDEYYYGNTPDISNIDFISMSLFGIMIQIHLNLKITKKKEDGLVLHPPLEMNLHTI